MTVVMLALMVMPMVETLVVLAMVAVVVTGIMWSAGARRHGPDGTAGVQGGPALT